MRPKKKALRICARPKPEQRNVDLYIYIMGAVS
nr:MAG TPA: hypothetical protein [Caudoviricetes sp.]